MSVLDVQFFTLLGICYFQIPVPITITCRHRMVLQKCAIYVGIMQFTQYDYCNTYGPNFPSFTMSDTLLFLMLVLI